MFTILVTHKLKLKESKFALFLDSVEFLGHKISARGIEVEFVKIEDLE